MNGLALVLLFFQNSEFVEEALPSRLVCPCDFIEAVRYMLNHLMKLIYVDLQDNTLRTDAFGGVGVRA